MCPPLTTANQRRVASYGTDQEGKTLFAAVCAVDLMHHTMCPQIYTFQTYPTHHTLGPIHSYLGF